MGRRHQGALGNGTTNGDKSYATKILTGGTNPYVWVSAGGDTHGFGLAIRAEDLCPHGARIQRGISAMEIQPINSPRFGYVAERVCICLFEADPLPCRPRPPLRPTLPRSPLRSTLRLRVLTGYRRSNSTRTIPCWARILARRIPTRRQAFPRDPTPSRRSPMIPLEFRRLPAQFPSQ